MRHRRWLLDRQARDRRRSRTDFASRAGGARAKTPQHSLYRRGRIMDESLRQAVAVLAVAMIVAIAARQIRLPYTVGLVIVGAAVALSGADFAPHLTHDLIFDLILPPLLFEAALTLSWRELVRDSLPLLSLAGIGTVVSAAVVTASMTTLLGWPLFSAMLFGALIAATDPVAIIAMFKDNRIKGRMRLLVESESLLNDGAAAVLFVMALAFVQSGGADQSAAATALTLVKVVFGGVVVGALVRRGRHPRLAAHLGTSHRSGADDHRRIRLVSGRRIFPCLRRAGDGDGRSRHGQSGPAERAGRRLHQSQGARIRSVLLGFRGFSGQFHGVSHDWRGCGVDPVRRRRGDGAGRGDRYGALRARHRRLSVEFVVFRFRDGRSRFASSMFSGGAACAARLRSPWRCRFRAICRNATRYSPSLSPWSASRLWFRA